MSKTDDTAKADIPDIPNDNKIDELPVGLETSVFWTASTDDLNTFINLGGDQEPTSC